MINYGDKIMGILKRGMVVLFALFNLNLIAEKPAMEIDSFLKDYPKLAELISKSWKENQQLKATHKEKMAAVALKEATTKNWFPQFWASSGVSRNKNYSEFSNNYSTNFNNSINITQPLWDSDIHYQTKTAQSVVGQFKWANISFRNQLAFNVLAAYFDYQTKLKNQEIYKLIIKNAEKREANVKSAVELGKTLKVDLLETKTKLLEKKQQLVKSKNDTKQALKLLSLLTNQKLNAESLEQNSQKTLQLPKTSELIEMSLTGNPELLKLKEKRKMFEHRYDQLTNELVPDLYASGSWGYSSEGSAQFDSESERWSAGVNLVWHFGDSTRSSRKLAILREKQAISENIKYYNKQLPTEINNTATILKTIETNLKSLKLRIKHLNELYKLREEQYRAGQITITDLTLSEENLLQTQLDYSLSLGEYNVTAMQLWLLAGGEISATRN